MAAAVVLMVVASALALLIPYLTKVAIDGYIAHRDTAGLARVSVLMAAAFIGTYLATAGQNYLLGWVAQRVLATMRGQLFRHLQGLSLSYHDTHIVGVTISRVISDVSVINDLLSQGLLTLAGNSLLLIGIIAVMISMSPTLALLTFSVLPVMVFVTESVHPPGTCRLPRDARPHRSRHRQPGRKHHRHARYPGLRPGGVLAGAF